MEFIHGAFILAAKLFIKIPVYSLYSYHIQPLYFKLTLECLHIKNDHEFKLLYKDLLRNSFVILNLMNFQTFFEFQIPPKYFQDGKLFVNFTKYSQPYQILSIQQDNTFIHFCLPTLRFSRPRKINLNPNDTLDQEFNPQSFFSFNQKIIANVNSIILSGIQNILMEIKKRVPFSEITQNRHFQNSELIKLIPRSLLNKCITPKQNQIALIHESICLMHSHPRIDQLTNFFKQLNINRHVWNSLGTGEEKTTYIMKALDKNIEDKLQKIKKQVNNFTGTQNQKKTPKKQKIKGPDFEWLNLPTKNEMLKPKLKTKLVQSINQYKNQVKLRKAHGKILDEAQKIALEDDSFDLKVQTQIKMKYQWTKDDEQIFHTNLKHLKQKFNKTQFLKYCQRYKFITNHQLCTLASEQVSRKLDKSTKAFLSRQFLLDKYYSSKDTLTEKQMKFILKTSPLLSKCVDKNFIKTAVRNIKYQDIDKMQLQIAEDIIKKFQSIRSVVKDSRKDFKQKKNQKAKNNIRQFQEKKKYQIQRMQSIEQLAKHQTKMLRRLNYKSTNQAKKQNSFSQTKKTSWPVPLNNMHPSTGVFIKEGVNEQISQDKYNHYQKKYLQQLNKNPKQGIISKSQMIRFYTGGPLQKNKQYSPHANKQSIKLICQTFKRFYYQKQISLKLDTINIEDIQTSKKPVINFKTSKIIGQTMKDITKRTKKSTTDEVQQNQQIIRQKIIEGKQKTKNAVIIKKLLTLAAENSFGTLKALNPKLSPLAINCTDKKGNTALYYAVKHRNSDFIEYLLNKKADMNVKCSKGLTPLHLAFKTNQYSLICKCLTGIVLPNLNTLDDENRTPLFYCSRKILEMLSLESGVVEVQNNQTCKFDNNQLLHISRPKKLLTQDLQCGFDFRKKQQKDFFTQY